MPYLADELREIYENMSLANKQHMANKLLKEDQIVAQKLRDFIPTDYFTPEPPSVGSLVTYKGKQYLVACESNKRVFLVCIADGRVLGAPRTVRNPRKLTKNEWRQITEAREGITWDEDA